MTTLELARDNYLKPNGFGGYVIRQSDLSSWARCQLQKYYQDRARANPEAPQGLNLSATTYGSIVHMVLQHMEQWLNEGRESALEDAVALFEHYWAPANMATLVDDHGRPLFKIDTWIAKQTWAGLLERGRMTLRQYYELQRKADTQLLALEYQFAVPLEIDGRLHTFTGTVDRLEIAKWNRKPYLSITDYKGLALDTPLPTPAGWTTMGEVQVGDELIGSDGHPTRVTIKSSVHADRDCYRITFDDGSSVIADHVHLWQVDSGAPGSLTREIVDTAELARRQAAGEKFRIPNAAVLRTPHADLPIDPYLLGVWLGDGKTSGGEITSEDQDVFDQLESRGFLLGANQESPVAKCRTHTVEGLRSALIRYGLLGEKHVPSYYFRASWSQRLDLLRGLMDSDGSWNQGRSQAVFTNTNERLADAVTELVVSMGWKASKHQVKAEGFGKQILVWRVTFTPFAHNPFLLPRKADLVDTLSAASGQRCRRRMVKSVEQVPTVPTQCIQVDAPDSLFLCGRHMIPTHNTGKQPTYLRHNVQFSGYSWASTLPEFWEGWDGTPEYLGELEHFDAETIGALERSLTSWGYRLHSGSHGDLPLASRRGRWINLQEVKFADAGWRNERDHARFMLAVDGYVRGCEAAAYTVNLSGEVCAYCPWRKDCGGIGLPDEEAGKP